MAAETLSLPFSYLSQLQLASYSNATTGVDAGEVDWEASHLPFFSRLTCLLKQFNWQFIPLLCVILCTARERTRVLGCNVIIALFCGVVRICDVTGSYSSFLNCNVLGTP